MPRVYTFPFFALIFTAVNVKTHNKKLENMILKLNTITRGASTELALATNFSNNKFDFS